MRAELRRRLVVGIAAMAASLTMASPSLATVTIGSNLRGLPSPTEGVCALPGTAAGARSCTDSQFSLVPGHTAVAGLTAPAAGTIVRWRVLSGALGPNTASVRLQLRVLRENDPDADAGPVVSLPSSAGIHTFPVQMPIEAGDRLAVESVVTGSGGGPAYAPIAHFEPGIGNLDEWSSPLFRGLTLLPETTREGAELLLNADLDLDRTPPRTKLTYAPRQDFLAKRKVVVYLRSNETATALAGGQLEISHGRTTVIFGLRPARATVPARKKVALRLRMPKSTRKAARLALLHGRKTLVKVTVSAEDAAGNESGKTVATIRAPR